MQAEIVLPYSFLVPLWARGKSTRNYYREDNGVYYITLDGKRLIKLYEHVLFPVDSPEDDMEYLLRMRGSTEDPFTGTYTCITIGA